MWDTEFNTVEKTMTQSFPNDIIVFTDLRTNEVSVFKAGVLNNRINDPNHCQDKHLALLLRIDMSLKQVQGFA